MTSRCDCRVAHRLRRMSAPRKSQRWESNPQPPHYECGALPIEATLAFFPPGDCFNGGHLPVIKLAYGRPRKASRAGGYGFTASSRSDDQITDDQAPTNYQATTDRTFNHRDAAFGLFRHSNLVIRNKTGVSDVPKTFWKAGVARGKSTTTAKHVRDPTGQPRLSARPASGGRVFILLAPSAPNSRQCSKMLHARCCNLAAPSWL